MDNYYDVVIVGAGPSGSTAGFYMAKNNKNFKVALLDKETFPRDKICGDAVTTIAQEILIEMGALQKLRREGKAHFAQSGGIVSPGGYAFIGDSATELKLPEDQAGVACAIRRKDLDVEIAHAARDAGCNLLENNLVTEAIFDVVTGTWLVRAQDSKDENVKYEYRARVLICADGATSGLARYLGVLPKDCEPQAVCSRQYWLAGEDNFNADGVCYYPSYMIPGYAAVFRESNNQCNFLTYIIPGGALKNEDLKSAHEKLLDNDLANILNKGKHAEEMKSASLRLGGIDVSHGNHLLVIGDACGLIDPLSGEGIHHAMCSGKYAAEVIQEAFTKKDWTARVMKKYDARWKKEFELDFFWSTTIASMITKFPWFMDAAALTIARKGGAFLADWAQVMTGSKSKVWFVRPDVALPLLFELLRVAIVGAPPRPKETKEEATA